MKRLTSSPPSHNRRVRAVVYAALSLVMLVALVNTGWARLGPLGMGLALAAFLTGRLLNRPWLLAHCRSWGGAIALLRDLGGQAALALCLFWVGDVLSMLTKWSPDFAVGRPAGVILVVGGLRRWLFPPQLGERGARLPASQIDAALGALPRKGVSRHLLLEVLAQNRGAMSPDRYALQVIDRAAASARPSDRLAMVLAVTDPKQAAACAGRHDLSRAFDVLSDGRDAEALLTFALRAAALLEDRPATLVDLPRPERMRKTAAATPSRAAAAGLHALASRIEAQENEMYSL